MKKLTQLIITILSLQIGFGSAIQTVQAAETEKTDSKPAIAYRVALQTLRDMAAKNPNDFIDPSETRPDQNVTDKVAMMEANQAMLKKVNDNSYSMSEVRAEIRIRLESEFGDSVAKIRNMLQRMDTTALDQLAKTSFEKGRYSPELKMEYETAYLLNEKRDVLYQLLYSDLLDAKSDATKRLGLMERKTLAKELSGTNSLLNMKGDGAKIAIIVILSIVAAGLISAGIVSGIKNAHARKSKELENEYEKKTAEEIIRHQKELDDMIKKHGQDIINTNEYWALKTQQLQQAFADRAAIREAGYTWQICSTTTQSMTVTCPYDHKTYVGTQKCANYCLKNPAGQQLGVNQLICSSAQIPWECYRANAYDSGYGAGADKGYDDGYTHGYNEEYARAYNSAYQDYYDIAYDEGYTTGYQHGFDDGYSDGLADGKYDGYHDGYDDGYPEGYAAGYDYGLEVGSGG